MTNNTQYPGIQPPRPPVAPMGPPQSAYPSVSIQFHPVGPPRPPPSYIPMVSQQFITVGRPNIGQPMQHLPPRPGPLPHTIVPPPAQAFAVPDGQPVSPQAQNGVPLHNNYMQGGPRGPLSLTYNLSSSTNMPSFPLGGPSWSLDGQASKDVTPVLQPAEEIPVAPVANDAPKAVGKAPSDWIEHTSRKGKQYYHNKKTKQSCWEKPLDLMSPIERADASTDWKECTAPDGRKYYYNKVTMQSKWKIPDDLKLARQKMKTESSTEEHEPTKDPDHEASAPSVTCVTWASPDADSPLSGAHEIVSSAVLGAPQSGSLATAELSTSSIPSSKASKNCPEVRTTSEETQVAAPPLSNTEDVTAKDAEIGTPAGSIEELEKATLVNPRAKAVALEEKTVDPENQVYENKQDAKNAFKALLENANVASDWTWDQVIRVIINDKRYSALRTLSERKQAFNEYIGQKKKQEAEERRNKQRKAREEFKKMLDESKEITSSTKWSKAYTILEADDRFKAVERFKDREDLFEDHIMELEKKERTKALEEYKKNKKEYIEFLKSCDFIKASSQWRKVQDRLEADESCLRLEKFHRLEIFQEYVRDLEKDEEEQRKLRMEELRKTERKNREEFRKLMEGHIASGMMSSKTHWRDYCIKVKDLPPYLAVSSNTSGATAKDLFEDVIEELEKQYVEDRDQIKEAVKMRKVSVSSTWTLEEFKNAIAEDISSHTISDVNLKLALDELQERVREREEKETKRRKRLADDFYLSLSTSKEITSSSRWEDIKPVFQDRLENWFTVEESFFKEIFDKYLIELKKIRDERKHREDKAKKSVDRDRRSKSRREKERGGKKRRKDETDSDNGEDSRRLSGREKEKKHRKRYLDDDKEDEKDKHRHSLERKRTKLQLESVEYESRHKRYKRDHRRDYDAPREAEDGEVW